LKETKSSWLLGDGRFGYVQGVKVDKNIFISGQLRHDEEGNVVGAALLDDSGHIGAIQREGQMQPAKAAAI
jgi:hypothetical protein